jgi:hypothetical protein
MVCCGWERVGQWVKVNARLEDYQPCEDERKDDSFWQKPKRQWQIELRAAKGKKILENAWAGRKKIEGVGECKGEGRVRE